MSSKSLLDEMAKGNLYEYNLQRYLSGDTRGEMAKH